MKTYRIAGALAAAVLFSGGALPSEEQFNLEPASLAQLEKAVRSRGDPARGREIFLDTRDAQCANCHRIQGVGGHVGPALGSIMERLDIRQIAEALIAPSRKLTEGYETYTIARTDGKILSGLKLKDSGNELLLRDGLGKDTVIQKEQISRIEKSPVSLMPARLVSPEPERPRQPYQLPQESRRSAQAQWQAEQGMDHRPLQPVDQQDRTV